MKVSITVNTKDTAEIIEAIELLTTYAVKTPVKTDEPKKKPTGRIRPKAEPKAEVEVKPAVKEEVEEVEDKPAVKEEVKVEATLGAVKTSAKEASGRVGREKVLDIIKGYAPKLADVDEKDYADLVNKLNDLDS